jgi:hypothetical protein
MNPTLHLSFAKVAPSADEAERLRHEDGACGGWRGRVPEVRGKSAPLQ